MLRLAGGVGPDRFSALSSHNQEPPTAGTVDLLVTPAGPLNNYDRKCDSASTAVVAIDGCHSKSSTNAAQPFVCGP
jgi:hypothetical protein